MKKQKRKPKGSSRNESSSKNRNRKKPSSKREPRRISVRRKPSAPKPKPKPKPKRPTPPRSTKISTRKRSPRPVQRSANRRTKPTKRIAVDTRFWRTVKRRSKNTVSRAGYSTKTILKPRDRKKGAFRIKKKTKALKLSVTEKNQSAIEKKLVGQVDRYLKGKKAEVFFKLAYRDKNNNLGFASVTRQMVPDELTVDEMVFTAIELSKGYGDVEIAGYEIETTL